MDKFNKVPNAVDKGEKFLWVFLCMCVCELSKKVSSMVLLFKSPPLLLFCWYMYLVKDENSFAKPSLY